MCEFASILLLIIYGISLVGCIIKEYTLDGFKVFITMLTVFPIGRTLGWW